MKPVSVRNEDVRIGDMVAFDGFNTKFAAVIDITYPWNDSLRINLHLENGYTIQTHHHVPHVMMMQPLSDTDLTASCVHCYGWHCAHECDTLDNVL